MTSTIKKKKLVINKLTTQQYIDALEDNLINDDELYMTTDSTMVSDVKVDGTSVVTDKIANLGTMAVENTSSYYTKTETDTALNDKIEYAMVIVDYTE